MPYDDTYRWVKTSSGNGFVPGSSKPLPEPMFDFLSVRFSDIDLRVIKKVTFQPLISKFSFEII